MNIIGIIVEYNPFHNGHMYHIQKIKELYPNSLIVAVTSTSFCQRGNVSILNKWDKTKIALENNVDLVIELPFVFSSQSADLFAKGALQILNSLKVEKIVFGSECNDTNLLKDLANKQVNDKKYDNKVKKYLKEGVSYPTALAKALNYKIDTPNDLLAISYIKEIIKNNYDIEPIAIKRTNNYHDKNLSENIASATAIRENIDKDIKKYLPINSYKNLYKIDNKLYFKILKYKIISDINNLDKYQTVDEGIENRIKKYIYQSNNLEELISKIKTKRYTYNKLNRMFTHILCSFTKEEARNNNIEYIRVLGFNEYGKSYLNRIKKEINVPIITSYRFDSNILDIEYRVTGIYSIITNDKDLIKKELEKPIIL